MIKQKAKNIIQHYKLAVTLIIVMTLLSASVVGNRLISAQSLQQQINALQAENSQKKDTKYQLTLEANDLNDKIGKLQGQINALQAQITANQAKSVELQAKIAEAEAELARQKKVLGENIKQMYLEGEISTLEMLASSKDLSEFVDKQQYRTAVQEKIKETLAKITELRHQLTAQKEALEKLIAEQTMIQGQLAAQRAEQDRLLSLNASQRSQLDSEIKQNAGRIAELQRQQVLENARLAGGRVPAGIPGGGGYPWGDARCLHAGYPDSSCPNYDYGYTGYGMWDKWGYGYRNCTSWVAYKVEASGRNMASGLGNARDWPGNAAARGYSVSYGSGARPGDAAVIPSGYYGHVMYVEAVEGGTVYVSDYNFGGDGYYRGPRAMSASGLVFVHF